MKILKKMVLVMSLATSHNVFATEIVNCDKSELDKDFNYFCLINKDGNYYIKETISLLKEPVKSDEDAFKKKGLSFEGKVNKRTEHSNQIYRIQKVEKIDDEIFNHDFKMENQNGLITIIDENNRLYTLRSGYVQENGHYLEIRNNKLNYLKKESIENVKKVSSYYEMYALNYDNELWNKKDNIWEKVDIGTVYDFVYLEDGRVYALTDKGIYKNKPVFEKNKLEENDLIVDDFTLMELKIEESLYSGEMEYQKYKTDIEDSLFNKNSKLGSHLTGAFSDQLEPYFKDKYNSEYDIEINSETIDIIDSKHRGFDRASIHYRNPVRDNQLESYYYRKNTEIENQSIYSIKNKTYLTTVLKNRIKTKFNGDVILKNKEKVILKNKYTNPVSNYEYRSDIVNIKSKDGVYFSLRSNGMLSIFDTVKEEEYEMYNVNNIFAEDNGIYILIDKDFNSELSTMKTFPIINPSSGTNEEKFIFKFTSFKDLSKDFKTKHLAP